MKTEKEMFEDRFPIPAHWINFDESKCKYVCKYNAIDSVTIKYQAQWEAWQASASREGYKLVPVQPDLETMQNMSQALRDNTGETPKRKMQEVYKAAIESVGH